MGSVFKGKNKIAVSAKVVNCFVENSIICENVEIYNSVIKDSVIKDGAVVGPFAHIRDGAVIGEGVRIGNFVEVKNSKIGKYTKVAHMSYIGDAEIGENCNIGAGVIFCNYNGFEKQKITLGDWVFVGSNSNLVAPVEIKDKAFIAAGTTITKNVDEEKNVVGRARQEEFLFENPYLKKFPKPKWFGTDGIRGVWGKELNEKLVKEVAKALCHNGAKTVVVGRDTRPSGKTICKILKSVFGVYGVKVIDLGVVSTPCVAFATKEAKASFGVMITASHNPAKFNGIKIFDSTGEKLSGKKEIDLENNFYKKNNLKKIKNNKNKIKNKYFLIKKYKNHIKSYFLNNLNNTKIIIDCANGSASFLAKEVFDGLGASVEVMNIKGEINKNCGALFTEHLQKIVQEKQADLGFAFDGDADRVIAVNSKGDVLDGDDILYILAKYFKLIGKLEKPVVVGTVMTNLGLEKKMLADGISLIRTDVGDKWIAKKLKNQHLFLGAEQVGHVLLNDDFCLGDGLLVARIVAQIFKEKPELFLDLKTCKTCQVKKDISLEGVSVDFDVLSGGVKRFNEKLGEMERIVARKSGTENKFRVMAESENEEIAKKILDAFEEEVLREAVRGSN